MIFASIPRHKPVRRKRSKPRRGAEKTKLRECHLVQMHLKGKKTEVADGPHQ